MLDLELFSWRRASYLYKFVGLLANYREYSWLLQWADSLGATLVALVLVFAPFVATTLIGVLLLACGLYWLLLTLSDNQPPNSGAIHLLVILYWCVVTVSVAFSPVKLAALSGWIKLTLYLFMFFLAARVLRNKQILSWIITTLLHVFLVVSIYGVRQEFFGVDQLATWNDPNSPLAQDTRVYSYLGNPNLLAAYLLSAFALSVAAVFVWRGLFPKALAMTMVIVNASCLYFTDSRGGWIGMLALMLVLVLLLYYWWYDYLPQWARIWLLPIAGGACACCLILGVLLIEPLRLRVMSIFAWRGDSSNNFRINVWLAVLEMIGDRPWLGIGPGNQAFNLVYPLYMRPNYTALSAYSIYLETLVETGIIGLSCLLWLIGVIFAQGLRELNVLRQQRKAEGLWIIGAIAAMAGMLVHGVADTVWYRPQVSTLWWLMVAIIASQISVSSPLPSPVDRHDS